MEYNPAGQKIRQVYANGVSTDYGFNSNGWLETIKDDHDVLNLNMIYDKIGNITKRENLLRPEFTESYSYDAISQLVSFSRGESLNKTYEFDLIGNRVRTTENGVETKYVSDNVNAYTAILGNLSFIPNYDDNGNMLNYDKHNYVYDYNNKLVELDETKGVYKYDALGRIISKNDISYYYVGDQIVQEVIGNNVTTYLHGNKIDEILQVQHKDISYWYHANHLGSTLCLSDSSAYSVEQVNYNPYGTPILYNKDFEASLILNSFSFNGLQYNYEAKQYLCRSRFLSPLLGRFTQKDKMGYINGLNDYSFVQNNPILYSDPFGYAKRGRSPLKFIENIAGKENAKKAADWSMKQKWMERLNIGLYHEQWFYDDGTNIGYGNKSDRYPDGRMDDENINEYTMLDEYYDDWEVRDVVNENQPEDYGLYFIPIRDCQSWTKKILDEVERRRLERSDCGKNRPFCKYYPDLCEQDFCVENPGYCKMRELMISLGKAFVRNNY